MLSRNTFITSTIIVVLMLFGAGLAIFSTRFYQNSAAPESIPGLLWPDPKQLTDFSLLDHNGKPFGKSELQGHWSLLFFGYSYCPDVCPVTLSVMEQVQSQLQLQPGQPALQSLFITVDPQRDTTSHLAKYISYFNGKITALGGSDEQIDQLASQIGIAHITGPVSTDGSYMVQHTGSVFLLDPKSRLVGIFSAPHNADTLMTGITAISGFISRQD